MNTLVIYSYSCKHEADKVCKESSGPVYVVEADFPFDITVSPNVTVASYDSFFSLEEYQFADKWIHEFWDNWCAVDDVNYAVWNGLELSRGVEGRIFPWIYCIVRDVFVAQKLFDTFSPDIIYCGSGDAINVDLWEKLAALNGIKFARMEKPLENRIADIDNGLNDNALRCDTHYDGLEIARKAIAKLSGSIMSQLVDRLLVTVSNAFPKVVFLSARPAKEMAKLGIDINLCLRKMIRGYHLNSAQIKQIRSDVHRNEFQKAFNYFTIQADKLVSRNDAKERFSYKDVNIWPFISDVIRELIVKEMPRLAVESETARRFLLENKVDLLVSKVVYQGEPIIWKEVAAKLGVETVVLQREQFWTGANEGFPKITGDWFLTQGDSSDEFLQRHSRVPRNRLIQYGCASRKELNEEIEKCDPHQIRRIYGLSEAPIVLFADGHYCGTSLRDSPIRLLNGLKTVINCAKALPEFQFLIKLHPGGSKNHNEGEHYISRRMDVFGQKIPENVIWLPLSTPITHIFSLKPIVVSVYSTVGIEAMAAKLISIFLYSNEDGNELLDFEQPYPAALCIRNQDELTPLIECIFHDYEKFLKILEPGQLAYWNNIFSEYKDPIKIIKNILKEKRKGWKANG